MSYSDRTAGTAAAAAAAAPPPPCLSAAVAAATAADTAVAAAAAAEIAALVLCAVFLSVLLAGRTPACGVRAHAGGRATPRDEATRRERFRRLRRLGLQYKGQTDVNRSIS